MAVFDPSFHATIIHAPGTSQEKRWDARIGGNCNTKALLQVTDRAVVGDEILCELFDRPRVVLSVTPVIASGQIVYWDALIAPRTEQDGTSQTVSPSTKRAPTSTKPASRSRDTTVGARKGDITLLEDLGGSLKNSVSYEHARLYLGVSRRQVERLVSEKKVLVVIGGGHNKQIRVKSLLAYLPTQITT